MVDYSQSGQRAVALGNAPMHWQIQEAKSRLSEVMRAAHAEGPQFITRHGKEDVVMISVAEYRRLQGVPSFKQLLFEGPPFVDELPLSEKRQTPSHPADQRGEG